MIMVDPRWLDVIVKYEGINALSPSINVDESGQDNTHLSPNAALLKKQKLALALSGATMVVFFLLMIFVPT
jgi:hypothetical protein